MNIITELKRLKAQVEKFQSDNAEELKSMEAKGFTVFGELNGVSDSFMDALTVADWHVNGTLDPVDIPYDRACSIGDEIYDYRSGK